MTLTDRGKRISDAKRRTSRWGGASAEYRAEFTVWYNMIQRCTNERHPNYRRYGDRGITVCRRWLRSFWAFLADVGRRPSAAHSLERGNNDKGYSPSNCVWATSAQQRRNTSRNFNVTHDGVTKCAADWAKQLGMTAEGFKARVRRWGVELAFSTPVRRREVVQCHQ